MTAEDKAREMLARIDKTFGRFTAGELVELANLIDARDAFTAQDVTLIYAALEELEHVEEPNGLTAAGMYDLRLVAEKIDSLILTAPREAK